MSNTFATQMAAKNRVWKSSNLVLGTGFSRPYAFSNKITQLLSPYDYRSSATRYRANKQNIAFSILIDAPNAAYVNNNYYGTYLTVYVLSESRIIYRQQIIIVLALLMVYQANTYLKYL